MPGIARKNSGDLIFCNPGPDMADHASATATADVQQPASRPRSRRGFSLAALFGVITALCLFQAYRTNQQILKYYTPAPEVDFDLNVEPYQFSDADFVHPFDLRPAVEQLRDREMVIRDRIEELHLYGRTPEAEELESRLDRTLASREGPYPVDGKRQLHAVGIYNGRPHIHVTYQGGPVILVLCAGEATHWKVDLGPGVRLERVVISGHKRQTIEGISDEVPLHGHHRRYTFYAADPRDVPPVAEELRKLTKLTPTTFLTAHDLGNEPFAVGPENDEWSATMTLAALDPVYQDAVREPRAKLAAELVAQSFPELHCVPGSNPLGMNTSFAVHSVFGPYATTLQPLDESTIRFTVDPRGPSLFGFDWRGAEGIVTLDPRSGRVEPWPVAGLEVRPHYDSCLAFDTRRNRLLVWGEDLSAVDVLRKQATLIRNGNPGIFALAYRSDDDRLYALCPSDDHRGLFADCISELRTFNHLGAELSRVEIVPPIPADRWPISRGSVKLIVVGDKLIVLHLGMKDTNGSFLPSSTNYVIDPKTGKLLFACQRKPR
jgi:hypothetical protein